MVLPTPATPMRTTITAPSVASAPVSWPPRMSDERGLLWRRRRLLRRLRRSRSPGRPLLPPRAGTHRGADPPPSARTRPGWSTTWGGRPGPMPTGWPRRATRCTSSTSPRSTCARPRRRAGPRRTPWPASAWATRGRCPSPTPRPTAVLLLGPLYHLHERADRLAALREAARVLRPGGWLFAAGISHFASFVDGLRTGDLLDDPAFARIVEGDLRDGRHCNVTREPGVLHDRVLPPPRGAATPRSARRDSRRPTVFAVEGPAFVLPDFAARWSRPEARETLLRFLRVDRNRARAPRSEPALPRLRAAKA